MMTMMTMTPPKRVMVTRPLSLEAARDKAYAEAMAISELEYRLIDVEPGEWTIAALLSEATRLIEAYRDPRTSYYDALMGFDGTDEHCNAVETIEACRAFIRRWEGRR